MKDWSEDFFYISVSAFPPPSLLMMLFIQLIRLKIALTYCYVSVI